MSAGAARKQALGPVICRNSDTGWGNHHRGQGREHVLLRSIVEKVRGRDGGRVVVAKRPEHPHEPVGILVSQRLEKHRGRSRTWRLRRQFPAPGSQSPRRQSRAASRSGGKHTARRSCDSSTAAAGPTTHAAGRPSPIGAAPRPRRPGRVDAPRPGGRRSRRSIREPTPTPAARYDRRDRDDEDTAGGDRNPQECSRQRHPRALAGRAVKESYRPAFGSARATASARRPDVVIS